jgi:zinc protease
MRHARLELVARLARSPSRASLIVGLLALGALAGVAAAGGSADSASKPSAPAAAAPAAPAPAAAFTLPRPEIKQWKLGNGLDVVYVGVHRAPVVAVQVWYHVGSKDEPRDRRGTAHMFEHMMFKGTRNVPPEEHARLIDEVGGSENAFTAEDMTAYHDTVPRQYFDFAVKLEAERMRNLLFRESMVAREREVVKEEKRRRLDNSPFGRAIERFYALAYTRHPYAWTPAGDLGDLDKLTPAELKAFYDTYYIPNNATLIVVGDVSEDEVRAAAEAYFAKIPAGKTPPRPAQAAAEPKQTQARRAQVEPAQFGMAVIGYHIPAASSPDIFALQVMATILSDGESSRLYTRLVRKDGIAVYAAGQLDVREDPGMFILAGVYLDDQSEPAVEKAFAEEIARLQTEPVTEAELGKARNQLLSQFVFGLQDVTGLAMTIGQSKVLRGDATAWLGDADRYAGITAADVARVARTYLTPENATVVIIPPAGGGQ